jgi:hypothetical protein
MAFHNFEAIGKPVAMNNTYYKLNYNENSVICFYIYCWECCSMEIASLKEHSGAAFTCAHL